ncbi:hypothetical protein [Aeromonas media]|uniref:hypothetical protein n=1 Tax=Aeromonas media TaxID=651 RepID=UPI00227F2328|nr:hypothetical protein [Aeromonas media]MCY9822138.1 hypothetical protein [Aeromonas media]
MPPAFFSSSPSPTIAIAIARHLALDAIQPIAALCGHDALPSSCPPLVTQPLLLIKQK